MLYYWYKDDLGITRVTNFWNRPYYVNSDDPKIKVFIEDKNGNYRPPTKEEWVRESKAEIEERKRVNDLINSCFKTDWRDKFILWIKKHL
ncbi:MAG: hypothetical protein WBP16_06480 [Ferruginibacter sp.]